MTLRDLVSVVAAAGLRPDLAARMIGYAVVYVFNARSWEGMGLTAPTLRKLRRQFRDLGVDIDTLKLG